MNKKVSTRDDAHRAKSLPRCCLTEDYVRLLERAAAIHGGEDSPTGRAVVEKIRGSVVELCDDIPAGYVTLGSRVTFSVNGGPPLSRVLVHWDKWPVPGLDLSLATPWGVTLLGMRKGCESVAYWRDGTAETIKLLAVDPKREAPIDAASCGLRIVAGATAAGARPPRRPSGRSVGRRLPTDEPPVPPAA